MRSAVCIAGFLIALVPAGCSTTGGTGAASNRISSFTGVTPAENRKPPESTVVRAASPEPAAPEVPPAYPTSMDDQTARAPDIATPTNAFVMPNTQLQFIPVEPVFGLITGNPDPQVRQDAVSTIALMGATGAVHILRQANGSSPVPHGMRQISSGVDDLLQPDDDQAATSKQRRPPFMFSLGWKF
jgi:hypothetical protein